MSVCPQENSDTLRGLRVLAVLGGLELFGHERGNIEVFKVLRELGADVLVGVNAVDSGGQVGAHLRQLGFQTFDLPFSNQWSWQWLKRYPLSLFEKLKAVLGCSRILSGVLRKYRPHYVHVGSPLPYSYLSLALFVNRTPLVYRMGDCPPTDSPFNMRIWRMAMRRSQRVVAISEFVRDAASAAGVNQDKVSVIYNFAPDNPVRTVATVADASRDMEATRIVYVGAIAEHKGVLHLIEAFAEVGTVYPSLILDIVGGSRYDTVFRDKIIQKISDAGLLDRVILHGHVEDPSAFFRAASVHVVPSVWAEPLGNVVLEAKREGTPSVVFPSGGLPEMVRHKTDGYICAEKITAALTESLHWMLADRERLKRMGFAAREDFVERFGRQRFASSWAKIVRSVA